MADPAPVAHPSFREALRFWLKLGFVSFGGPAGQIAIMQHELVDRRRWIGQERFLHALNYCMLLPGPEAQQLAVYCGWLLHRTWGGIAAGVLFVLPGALALGALSYVYVSFGDVAWLAAFFGGLKPAVVAVVAAAVPRVGAKALRTPAMWAIAAAAFASIFALGVGFPWIVAGAALAGWAGNRWRPGWFAGDNARKIRGQGLARPPTARAAIDDDDRHLVTTGWIRPLKVTVLCAGLWIAPIVAAGLAWGWDSTLADQGVLFSKAAVVTFGGAYAVLPYVAGHAVEAREWLTAPELLAGLAFAEATPGPFLLVLQHIGFLGGWHQPDGSLSPLMAAALGAAMATWTTFLPCFLWIFLGAPHIERLRGNVALGAALSAVTAAVVGVILNLAVWFAWQVWRPSPEDSMSLGAWGVDWFAVTVSVAAFFAMHRLKANLPVVLAASGLAGLAWQMTLG